MASSRVICRIAPVALGALIAIVAFMPGTAGAALTDPGANAPPPQIPRLPADFHGRGRYIVRDMGVTVPFTWNGRDGNSQMVAGGPNYPIWFKNIIYGDTLYTITYKWKNVNEIKCVPFRGLDRSWLNGNLLRTSRYVGREILRGPVRYVYHWRVGLVFLGSLQPEPGPPFIPRIPAMLTDMYVGQNDRTRWWKVLQFGIQNQFDPALDEWLVMDTFRHGAGHVKLPAKCQQVPPPTSEGLDQILSDALSDLFDALQP